MAEIKLKANTNNRAGLLGLFLIALLPITALADTKDKTLNIAFNFDKAPFTFGKTSKKGIEIDLVREILQSQGYSINVHQMSKKNLNNLLTSNPAFDAVSSVPDIGDGLFYSDNFISYENYVITRKQDQLKIESLRDLKDIKFVIWKDAYLDLGKEFNRLFNPVDGEMRSSYFERTSQLDQHELFFDHSFPAIIVDKTIFQWYKFSLQNHEEYTYHYIFPKKTEYPVKFKSKTIRDAFNKGLKLFKQNGQYEEIIQYYLNQDIRLLLKYANLIADISGKFIFTTKPKILKNILSGFMGHPDIVHIEIYDKNMRSTFVSLDKKGAKSDELRQLPSISKDIFYIDNGNPLLVGEMKIYYKKELKIKYEKLIPRLYSFNNLELDIFDEQKLQASYNKFGVPQQIEPLNKKDMAYLKNKKEIRLCLHPSIYPYEYIEDGQHKGISADILKYITKDFKLNLKIIPAKNNRETFENVYQNKCDLKPTMVHKYNIVSDYMNETNTTSRQNLILITNKDAPFIVNIKSVKDKKILVPFKAIKQYLHKYYPFLNTIIVKPFPEIIEKLRKKEAYGFIMTAHSVNSILQKHGSNQLKVNIQLHDHPFDIAMGVSKKEPQLLIIMNKLLQNLSKEKSDEILFRWSMKSYNLPPDYTLVWQLSALFLFILLIIFALYLRDQKLLKKIKDEKAKFQNIFNHSADGAYIFIDGVISDCNKALVNLFGYDSKEQLIGLTPIQLSPEYQSDGKKSHDKTLEMIKIAKQEGANHFQWQHRRVNGEIFWADIMITYISKSNKISLSHIVCRDIQHKKEMETELYELNLSLEKRVKWEIEKNTRHIQAMQQQSKMAQMGEMLGAITHQWRQPLNAISTSIQNLKYDYREGNLNDEQFIRTFIEKSKNTIKFMSNTIDDFRNFYTIDKEKHSFMVLKATRSVVDMLVIKTNLRIEIQGNEFSFYGFKSEFQQVILNIVNNAKEVLSERKTEDASIDITIKNRKVIIKDNGGGIPDKNINKVFAPYFTTKDQDKGTGMGLYISRMIIEDNMGGILSVANDKDGAVFTIDFSKDKQ